jgi:hypothetical protein
MNELKIKEKDKLEVQQEKQQESKLIHDAVIVPHRGHKIYEININTNEINEANFEKKDYVFNPKWTRLSASNSESTIIKNSNCFYVSALNKKNAIKKFKELNNGSKLDLTKTYLSL